jgi:hypothetical protein
VPLTYRCGSSTRSPGPSRCRATRRPRTETARNGDRPSRPQRPGQTRDRGLRRNTAAGRPRRLPASCRPDAIRWLRFFQAYRPAARSMPLRIARRIMTQSYPSPSRDILALISDAIRSRIKRPRCACARSARALAWSRANASEGRHSREAMSSAAAHPAESNLRSPRGSYGTGLDARHAVSQCARRRPGKLEAWRGDRTGSRSR